jgi:UDP-glucose 4-epimerase
MRVLVTGGAGFIGSKLMFRLLEEGCKVCSLDDYSFGCESRHKKGCDYFYGDVSELSDYSFIGDVDFIFHLAARARIRPSFDDPSVYMRVNVNGTFNVASYASSKGIPLVYASSGSIHAGSYRNPYTFSKEMGEEVVKFHQECRGLEAAVARFFNVYGPGEVVGGSNATLIGSWRRCMEQNVPLTIFGDGSKRRDFTHVEDIVDALVEIMKRKTFGHSFDLGRGKCHSVIEIANMFGAEVCHEADRLGEADSSICDHSLASDLLGWDPRRDVEDYIRSLRA